MNMTRNYLEPRVVNLFEFIRKGYTVRDLFFRGVSLKILSKVFTLLRYKFFYRGKNVDIDYRCIIEGAKYISIQDKVWLQQNVRLTVPLFDMDHIEARAYLIIGEGTKIGPYCTISAANRIEIGRNVLFGINVLVLDHMHQYKDITKPILHQGIISGGEVIIEDNVWIAANAVIYSSRKQLTIGRNSVVAANSVVRDSIAPFSIVSGNPARLIKKYNPDVKQWEDVGEKQ